MKRSHDRPEKPKRVAEPVQVYLDPADRDRLERLASQLDTSKSGVLRRGLEALERQLSNPDAHPALQIVGLAELERDPGVDYDVAREHDRLLTEAEQASWDGASGPSDE